MSQQDVDNVVSVSSLAKTFTLGFRRKRVEAVRGIDFSVRRGEVFGLIGPNGAGKTTTLKMIMGLIRPNEGSIEVLGEPVPDVSSRRRVGYLPEISYYYDYLKPEEILDFYGRLYGLDRKTRRKRVPEMLELVGLSDAIGKPLRKFSKGMLQRIGLGQALIADPELVILDEPQSGLDPIGRKDVADLIHDLKLQGKTIFFSSHILPDVERICDRVAVMVEGKIVDIGPLTELLNPRTLQTEIATGPVDDAFLDALRKRHPDTRITRHHSGWTLLLPEEADVQSYLAELVQAGITVESVLPRRESLEDVFVREATAESPKEDGRGNTAPCAEDEPRKTDPSEGGDQDSAQDQETTDDETDLRDVSQDDLDHGDAEPEDDLDHGDAEPEDDLDHSDAKPEDDSEQPSDTEPDDDSEKPSDVEPDDDSDEEGSP